MAVFADMALSGTPEVMRIKRETLSLIVAAGASQTAQKGLDVLRFSHRMRVEEIMNRLIRGQKRKPVGEFKSAMNQAPGFAQSGRAQGGFMHQLERETGGCRLGGLLGPRRQQIPTPQSQVLRKQQPKPHAGVRDLIGQQLPDVALQTEGIEGNFLLAVSGALNLKRRGLRTKLMEFFFASRNQR